MKIWIPKNREDFKQHLSDPLFKNTYFLMFTCFTFGGSGFFFWLIVARFYSAEDVGLASAIIAAMGLITTLSLLGFDISLIRFLPEREDSQDVINSCLTISFIVSLTLALVFVAGIDVWSPALSIIRQSPIFVLLFLVFTPLGSLVVLQNTGVFVGFRQAQYSFVQAIAALARIGIIPFLTAFGAFGIYFAIGLTSILAFIAGLYFTSRIFPYKPFPTVKRKTINDIFHFSSRNYIARIFEQLPVFVLPIMVINLLGAEANAHFFIAWSISAVFTRLPSIAISQSLLAEASYAREKLGQNRIRSAKFIFLLLILATVIIALFGKYILWIFGEEYARYSLESMFILVLGGFPFAINTLYVSVKRVQMKMKPVIWTYGGIAIATLGASYFLISFGIIGVAIAWLGGNGIVALFIGLGSLHKACRR